MTPIIMPDIGAKSHPAEVSVWLAQQGDTVMVGDRVVEVLIDGVTFDITTDAGGRLARIEAEVGDTVQAGMTLGWIEVGDGARNEK